MRPFLWARLSLQQHITLLSHVSWPDSEKNGQIRPIVDLSPEKKKKFTKSGLGGQDDTPFFFFPRAADKFCGLRNFLNGSHASNVTTMVES
jgi:hypothetical protein